MFEISQEQKKELLKYLAKRPYIEVAGLVAMIASLESVKRKKASKITERIRRNNATKKL